MAREAGFSQRHNNPNEWWMLTGDIERFYQAAYLAGAKAMQEKAARVCDDNYWEDHRPFADAIRAINPEPLIK